MTASLFIMLLVLAFLAFFLIWGHKRGFLKTALTTFAFVIAVLISMALIEPVSGLIENTKISASVENSVSELIDSKTEEFTGQVQSDIAQEEQEGFLETLSLPSYIQNLLKSSNTTEEYAAAGAENFKEYVTAKVTQVIINAIAYGAVMIIAAVLILLLLKASGFVNKIPVIGGINKFLGALLGLFEGLLILWVLSLLLIMFSGTSFGSAAVGLIQENALLNLIFDNNVLILIFGTLI